MFNKTLENNILHLYGESGKKWLANLPNTIEQFKTIHGLSNLESLENLSHHYLLRGMQNSQSIILKLGPDIAALKQETVALKAFAGFGAVKLLAEDMGMLLLENIIPGNSLKSYFPNKEDDAIQITCACLQRLHHASIPNTSKFPHIKDWLAVLDKDWQIPQQYLKKAKKLRDDLLQTATKDVLLHGDLHHENILQDAENWVVIDPKGVIGEPAYEVAAFIRNPIPKLLREENVSDIIQHRIDCFSAILKFSPQRIFDWCFVQSVLAWVWSIEDEHPSEYFKHLVSILDELSY